MARSFAALQANMMQNKGLANAMQNKAADVYQMISSGGYVDHDENGNAVLDSAGNVVSKRQNLAAHSANNSMATQIKDWATQSTATLERAARSGALTPQMMLSILDSDDPTVQSGIKSDPDKRRVLEAGASGFSGDWHDSNAVTQAASQYRANINRERDAKEYEQTWQTLLDQRERAEMNTNISRIADALNPRSGSDGAGGNNASGSNNSGDGSGVGVGGGMNSGQNSRSSQSSAIVNTQSTQSQPPAVIASQAVQERPQPPVVAVDQSTPKQSPAGTTGQTVVSGLGQTPKDVSRATDVTRNDSDATRDQKRGQERFQPPAVVRDQGRSQPPAVVRDQSPASQNPKDSKAPNRGPNKQ